MLPEDDAPKDRGFQFFLEATSPIPLPPCEGRPTLSLCCCFEFGLMKGLTWATAEAPPPLAPPKLLEDGGSFTWRLESWARQPYLLSQGLVTKSVQICFLFVKNHWRNQWTLVRETIFSSIHPSNSLVSASDPWRELLADTAPFKGPWFASCVASRTTENQGHRQVDCAMC